MRRRSRIGVSLTVVLVMTSFVAQADDGPPWGRVSVEAHRDTGGWLMAVEGPTGLPPSSVVRLEILRLTAPDGEPFGAPETTDLGTIDPEGRLNVSSPDRPLSAGSYRVRLRVLPLDQFRSTARTIPPAFYENPAEFTCRAGSLAERVLTVVQDLTEATHGLAIYAQAHRAFTEAEARNRARLDRGASWLPEEVQERRYWEALRARIVPAVETVYVSWRDEAARPTALWRTAAATAQACPNLLNRESETWSVLIGQPIHGFVPFAEDPGPVPTTLAEAHREAMLACLPLVEECLPEQDPATPPPPALASLARLATAWEEYCAALEPDGIPLADRSASVAAALRAFCDAPEAGGETFRAALHEARLALGR